MGKELELINKVNIINSKHVRQIYHKYSVNTGKPYYNCFPMELAVELFGKDAKEFLYQVSQGLCTSYQTDYEGVRYVDIVGFNLMKSYRATEIYREMAAKWKMENEVSNNDSDAGRKRTTKRFSGKRAKVTEV